MKLVKVNVGTDKYYSTFKDAEENLIIEEITKDDFLKEQVKTDCVWISSSCKIAFDTLTGELSDREYATQVNGFHWVKVPNYAVIKINPEFIKDDELSEAGIEEIEVQSVRE